MDRPTCGTCPYWDLEDGETQGLCLRYPPRLVPDAIGTPGLGVRACYGANGNAEMVALFQINSEQTNPATSPDYWCGEHPDFPAYIASIKTPKA
jgi:hypothetical protein